MKQTLQIIHVEDSREDSEYVQHILKADGLDCVFYRVETRDEFVSALQRPKCDLILSDCTLPTFHGLEALEIARTVRPQVPFVFVSGTIGEESAIESLQNGATDYVLKQRLARLVPAVRRALTVAEKRTAGEKAEIQALQSRKLEAIGLSIGGLAHDFRNLLQILKMGFDLVPSAVIDDPTAARQIIERMAHTIDRGSQMIDELLVFAKEAQTEFAPIDMAQRIREAVESVRLCLPQQVSLHIHLEEKLPAVLADPAHLERILTNLILNARDAMPLGGNIMISSDVIRFDRLPARAWKIKDVPYFRIMVSDTGTGMDEARQARIFDPFFTTKTPGNGTGLGLSVVFGLMEVHEGFIDLESKLGEGTTVSLFFPLPEGTADPDRIHRIAPIHLLGQTREA